MIVLELDPFSFILRHVDFVSVNTLVILAIKCLLCYYISHIGWYGVVSVVLTIVIQLHYGFFVVNKGLQLVQELSLNLIRGKSKKNRIAITSQKQLRIIREVLYTVKLVRLILPLVDEALYLILPFLLLFGEVIFVSCNYATVKMYDSVPMPFFLIVPSLSCFVILIVQVLFPPAASVFENSTKSLLLLRSLRIIETDKVWIRHIRATKPPRFNFGSMFYAKRSTKTTYIGCLLNDTINFQSHFQIFFWFVCMYVL